jgi:hypothetical protein
MNILKFPHFKPVNISMRDEIIAITSRYPAYHDFSIGNIFCWDTDNSLQICTLNENLVVLFPDYIDDSIHYLSYLGSNMPSETAKTLIEYSKQKIKQSFLRYIPEISVENLSDEFSAVPNRDDFDYVFETNKYVNFDGHILSKIKSEFGHFNKKYNNKFRVETKNEITNEDWVIINSIFSTWLSSKSDPSMFDQEKLALDKMSKLPNSFINIWLMLLYVNSKPAGFIIYELREGWGICHFAKADMQFNHIFNFLFIESFRILNKQGITNINLEPDLGIEGLRISKERKQPSGFLKKYTVSLKKS